MRKMPSSPPERAAGVVYALAAYCSWGVFPVYFKALKGVTPSVVLCHRILWSAVVMSAIIVASARIRPFLRAMRSGKVMLTLAVTTLLIAGNWLVYIWAVAQGHILEASLGYFVNPLVSVALGALFLRERLTWRQAVAVGLALCGVAALTIGSGTLPWISVVLAVTFAMYGLLRKTVAIDAAGGLLAETAVLVVPASLFLVVSDQPWGLDAMGWKGPALLLAAGPITALPLLWFANGARRLPLKVMGFLQYVSPTLQFLTATVVYSEPFRRLHVITFGLIWAGVALFMIDAVLGGRTRDGTGRNVGGLRASTTPDHSR
jgi:chloramphenicol-sensitive protein RarD